jgi:branched-chain amino acid transport system permease protein
MSLFLQTAVNGLATSLVYVFVGTAVTIINGVSRLVDFTQGQVLLLSAFVGYSAAEAGTPLPLAMLAGIAAAATWGVAAHRVLLRRLTNDALPMFIVTIGLAIVLESALVKIWGIQQHRIRSSLTGTLEIAGLTIPSRNVLFVVVGIPTLVALYLVLARSGLGRSMRAAAENRDAAALVGVDVPRMTTIAYLIGCSLSGLAGVLLGIAFPFTPFSGASYLIKGFAVALLGGLGSVTGAALVGVLLGLVETYAVAYGLPVGFYEFGTEWRDAYAFVVMVVVLVWRPGGLFGGTGELAR